MSWVRAMALPAVIVSVPRFTEAKAKENVGCEAMDTVEAIYALHAFPLLIVFSKNFEAFGSFYNNEGS